jgi:DNA-binding CsgD family transcriptional regulator
VARYLSLTGLDARYRAKVEALTAPLVAAARAGCLPGDPGLAAHVAWRLAVAAAPVDLVVACAHRSFAVDPLVAPDTQGELLGFAVRALLAVDRIAEAEQACTRALESARDRGRVLALGFARYHRALARLAAGALDGALADVLGTAEPALRGWTRGDVWRCELTARIRLARGETTAAGALLALDAPAPPTSLGWAFARQAEARLALAERRPDAAADLAARAGACLRALGQDVPALLPWRLTAAQAAWRGQRAEEARAMAAQALAAARAHPSRVAVGSALVTAGVVAPPDDRVALLREGCAVLAGTPALSERAGALIALGRALRQAGARTEARGLLREGLDLARSLSAGSLVQIARAELAAAGARPRRDRLCGPAALTATERRVADLAAAGRTNAGIGGELCIGRKTVESHLAQDYRKLGISGRGELDGALGATPPPGVSAETSGWRP